MPTNIDTTWETTLVNDVKQAVAYQNFWKERMELPDVTLHLAVFVEPYLQYVLEGQKTVESRFSTKRGAPYKRVKEGDIVLLKRAGGPVVGLCEVSYVWCYELDPTSWVEIKSTFEKALCASDPSFWEARESASFATLLQIQHVTVIEPVSCMKRDRRGWVVLGNPIPDK